MVQHISSREVPKLGRLWRIARWGCPPEHTSRADTRGYPLTQVAGAAWCIPRRTASYPGEIIRESLFLPKTPPAFQRGTCGPYRGTVPNQGSCGAVLWQTDPGLMMDLSRSHGGKSSPSQTERSRIPVRSQVCGHQTRWSRTTGGNDHARQDSSLQPLGSVGW